MTQVFGLSNGVDFSVVFFFFKNRSRKRQTHLYIVKQKENGREDYYFGHLTM